MKRATRGVDSRLRILQVVRRITLRFAMAPHSLCSQTFRQPWFVAATTFMSIRRASMVQRIQTFNGQARRH